MLNNRPMVSWYAYPGLKGNVPHIMDTNPERNRKKSQDILETVCKYYEVDIADVIGKKRNFEFVRARQAAIYLMTLYTNLTLVKIGYIFSSDHTTIIHSKQKVQSQLTNRFDDSWKNDIDTLKILL